MTISEIKNQFDKVLCYSQHLSSVNTEQLFKDWEFNKKKMFGDFFNEENNFIYEYPKEFSFSPGQNKLNDLLEEFIENVYYFNQDLYKFLCLNKKSFYDNILTEEYKYKDTVIPAGHKIIKAFKFFIEDKPLLEAYQNLASGLIQKTKIKGRLCISVNPLDYLSLSENAHNWRSCHSLDGAYRAGDLSYMADSATFICYLKSNEDTQITHFPPEVKWNSKKWRMLLFLSDSRRMMFAGRQYPFALDSTVLANVSECLHGIPMFNLNRWTHWDNSYVNSFKTPFAYGGVFRFEDNFLMGAQHTLIPLKKLIFEPSNPLAFNDLLHSSIYEKPYYRYLLEEECNWPEAWMENENEKFHIGADIKCLNCDDYYIAHETERMLCPNCKDHWDEDAEGSYCDYCGRESTGDMVNFKDLMMCRECYEAETAECVDCGRRHFKRQLVENPVDHTLHCRACMTKNSDKGGIW